MLRYPQKAKNSCSTCSLQDHTHRSPQKTSQRPLAPSSAISPAPAGSGPCSQWQWSPWRTHMQRGAGRWLAQSQCQLGGLPSHHLFQGGNGSRHHMVMDRLVFILSSPDCDGDPQRQTIHYLPLFPQSHF